MSKKLSVARPKEKYPLAGSNVFEITCSSILDYVREFERRNSLVPTPWILGQQVFPAI